ncbi:MAG: ATP-dependent Clp protease proteolytic subunit [Alphaproteobacteria bacterium]|nr:ATP-dependent Clp protease proteolytic subunit [Alphaproteobacteria bacterium]
MASYDFNDTAKSPSYETSANKLGKGAEVSLNDTVKAPELKSNAGDLQYMSADAARYFALMQATGMDAAEAKGAIASFQSPEGQASMKNIQAETQRYLGLLETAGKTGAKLEDIMDAPGLAALNKFVASAEGPVGRMVPTVTELENGRERGYDLYSLLMKKRIVLLEGQVDDTMASIANASLLYLASGVGENPEDHAGEDGKKKPIKVYVNSPGGSVLAGLSIYDTMRSIPAPIRTIGMGMQASMGSILLVAGDERMMTRNSYYMIHQPLSGNERSTQQTDLVIGTDFTSRLREQLTDIYVRHTGLKHAFWDIVLERDTWLTAQNALDMGVIQEIIVGTAKKTIHEEFSHRSEKDDRREAQIPKTAEGIRAVINTADGAAIRPELVVALSKFEEYWTPSRKAEYDAKQAATAKTASNDDQKAKPAKTKATPTL